MIEKCGECSKNLFIVNKKYNLCDSCNYKRLHKGKSKQEVYNDKLKKIINNKPINKISVKQSEKNILLRQIKREIEEDCFNEKGFLQCEGCGVVKDTMDKSHLVSIAQNKSLECVKENIQLLCRDCHIKWESRVFKTMNTLLCFESNLTVIKKLDLEAYNKIKNLEIC